MKVNPAAPTYLAGAPMRRWGGLIVWAFEAPTRPLPILRLVALQTACAGLRFEYLAWRAKMSLSMWTTRRETPVKEYTLSRVGDDEEKDARP